MPTEPTQVTPPEAARAAALAARRPAPQALATVTALTAFLLATPAVTPSATAQDDPSSPAPIPSSPPGTNTQAPPPVKTDPDDPDLKLEDGAKLADPKVLDIVSVVETQGGEERRSDTPTSITISLQAEVLFPKDSPKLNADAKARIAAIAAEIKKNRPDTVRVFGFTDNLGSYAHGKALSKARANTVHKELVNTIDAADSANITYQVRGYSEDYPIADNATEEGRKKNRRVEVTFPRAE
ncbi:OmpA family protein [Streptomyces boninensis]|uniref:OmpA family protein n=1 Tax=Streptomyces boninensis TaxID=2039455 RepID=UPI003B21D41A